MLESPNSLDNRVDSGDDRIGPVELEVVTSIRDDFVLAS